MVERTRSTSFCDSPRRWVASTASRAALSSSVIIASPPGRMPGRWGPAGRIGSFGDGHVVVAGHVVPQQLPLGVVGDVRALLQDLGRVLEAVAVGDVGAVDPAVLAEVVEAVGQQRVLDLEAEP